MDTNIKLSNLCQLQRGKWDAIIKRRKLKKIRRKNYNLPALCPFACYYKCDFIDYDVTISPEAKH